MKYILLFSTAMFLLLVSFNCKSPTAPKGSSPPDTTSNNFTFQTFTFGASNAGSSYLMDVAIVSDSDIWCVGAVYLDSANGAPDPFPYNAIHWDGKEWGLLKVPYSYQGQSYYHPLISVFAFEKDDVWFCGNGIIHWDGSLYNPIPIPSSVWGQYQINKIWGTSSNDFYVVGNGGSILHYQNDTWQKIESGTSMNIYDIWGAKNPNTGNEEILAVASYPDTSAQRKIFQINGNSAAEISSKGINWDLETVWFKSQSHYFVGGTGIYDKHLLSDSTWSRQYYNVTDNYINCIRGSDVNDIVAVGAFGEVLHYNGVRWTSFREETGLVNGEYLSVAIKGNEIVAVGYDGQRAVIVVGKR